MADIARLTGLFVSDSAAREIVAALDQLDQLAAPRAMRLSPRLEAIKRELLASTSRVSTCVDASAEAVAVQGIAQYESSVVDTATAAQRLGITSSGVTWLCRKQILRATRAGRRWYVDQASLADYQARRNREI